MDLDALADFHLVVAHGGIAGASRASGRPKASLSRRVMALEESLGVRLFERGSRSVHLTEDGELLHARTASLVGEIAEVAAQMREGRTQPRGRLRVNVPLVFGQLLMGRVAAEFSAAYPEVQLDVTMEDRAVDPVVEGYDVVVRVNPKADANLVGRCFVRDTLLIVAAPSLHSPLDRAGPSPGEAVPIVVMSTWPDTDLWRIPGPPVERALAVRPVLRLPALAMIRDAVITGIGAARLPRVLVAEDLAHGRLVAWAVASAQPMELWALHTAQRLASAKVKAFLRFLEGAFPDPYL